MPPIKPVTATILTEGHISGRVIRKKRVKPLAPSISAASYKSPEMLCRLARKMTIAQPVHCQICVSRTE